jgi:23S rRNA (cytosine1962-C5)-methyltransferase
MQKAWATFKTASGDERGKWEIKKPLPEPWVVKYQDTKFLLKLSPFKHTGLFAEQAAQWEWMKEKMQNEELRIKNEKPIQHSAFKILNLFAYTGGATMVLAKMGCQVTHVDASKPAITWANENHALNELPKDSVRWILDDCTKFVAREVKRGAKYDGIIMDPPAFGHSPNGKTWKFNNDLPGLLADCVSLLSDDAKFLLINGYATNSSALALNNLLEDAAKNLGGKIEFGELCLKQKSNRLISTGIFARWFH